MFYGNGKPNYYLYTDNQAAEHIVTQPNMNDHSRSIDICHHAIRQDYVNGELRIGGVATHDNTSDILTKNLQPPIHTKHTRELHITHERPFLSNNVVHCLTTAFTEMTRTRNPPNDPPNQTKSQKRKAKRQRKRERDYRSLPMRGPPSNNTTTSPTIKQPTSLPS